MRLNHITLDQKFQKLQEEFDRVTQQNESRSHKIEALERQQEAYLSRILELENELKIKTQDMDTVEKRNGLQKSEIEKLKQMHEKDSQSIQILEKSLA